MKKIFCLMLLLPSLLRAQTDFQKTTIEGAFAKAKADNKPVFLEIFSPTCHVCQSFMPIFESKEVGNMINPSFVPFKIDVASKEFEKFEKEQNIYVPSLPLIMIFYPNGKFMHHGILGENQGPNEIKSIISIALDPQRRSSIYANAYKTGNRETNFLIEYAMLNKIQRDTAMNIQVSQTLFNNYPKAELNSRTSWLIVNKLVLDLDNGFFKYWVARPQEAAGFAQGQEAQVLENIIFSSLFSSRGSKYNTAKITEIKGMLKNLGRSDAELTRMMLLPEIKAQIKDGKELIASKTVSNYFSSNSVAAPEISFVLSIFNDGAKSTSYLAEAQTWLKKGAQINKGHLELAGLHYESSRMYSKSGNKTLALKCAKMGLSEAILGKATNKTRYSNQYNSLK